MELPAAELAPRASEHEYPCGAGSRVPCSKDWYFSQILGNPNDPDSGPYAWGHCDQEPYHRSGVRFKGYKGGGRGGKSRGCSAEMGPLVLTPGTRGAIIAPKFELGQFEFRYLVDDLDRVIKRNNLPISREQKDGGSYGFSPRQGRMYAGYAHQTSRGTRVSEFAVYSAAPGHVEDIVGNEYDWVIIAEAANIRDPMLWPMVRVRLRSRMGIATLAYNPRGGRNWVTKLMKQARDWPDWSWHEAHADNNPGNVEKQINPDELDEVTRKRMIEGTEASMTGLVYHQFAKARHVKKLTAAYGPRAGHERWGGIDFGWRDPFVCLFAVVIGKGKDSRLYVYREYRKTKARVERHATKIREFIKMDGGFEGLNRFFADWDPAGCATLKLRDIYTKKAHKDWSSGYDWLAELFETDRIVIDPSCSELIDELESYEWAVDGDKPANGQSDHGTDALRYLAIGLKRNKTMI